MARDESTAAKLARDLPKFGEVVRLKKAILPTLGGKPRHLELFWDIDDKHKQGQVFIMRGRVNGEDFECHVSKQALEHFLRAV